MRRMQRRIVSVTLASLLGMSIVLQPVLSYIAPIDVKAADSLVTDIELTDTKEADVESYTGDVLSIVNTKKGISTTEQHKETEQTGIETLKAVSATAGVQENVESQQNAAEQWNAVMQQNTDADMKLGQSTMYDMGGSLGTTVTDQDIADLDKGGVITKTYKVGDTKQIKAGLSSYGDDAFTIEVVYAGEHCTIWRDQAKPDDVTAAEAKLFAEAFDNNIYDKIAASFGTATKVDVDQDGKVALLFHELTIDSYAGYFTGADLFSEELGGMGTQMDMIHLNTGYLKNHKENDYIDAKATLAHEYQHLVNFAVTGGKAESWLNETFSMAAIAITGYANNETISAIEGLKEYIEYWKFACPFIYAENFTNNASPIPYAQWYLFGRYLAYQTIGLVYGGNNIYKKILYADGYDQPASCTLEHLEKALTAIGYISPNGTIKSIDDVVNNYSQALYVKAESGKYSLIRNMGQENYNPSCVDGVTMFDITPVSIDNALTELPGGGAMTWVDLGGRTFTPGEHGTDIVYGAISAAVPDTVVCSLTGTAVQSYNIGTEFTLSAGSKTDKIYYTDDGTDPVKSETRKEYTKALTLSKNVTVKAVAEGENGKISKTASWSIHVKPSNVKASIESGEVAKGTYVALSCDMDNTEIYYTLDESEPTITNGILYTTPIYVEKDTLLRAMSVLKDAKDVENGTIKTFEYRINTESGDRYESNDTAGEATAVNFPTIINATLHNGTDQDYYTFTLENKTKVNITLTPPAGASYGLSLLDADGTIVTESRFADASQNINEELSSGKYYVKAASLNEKGNSGEEYQLSIQKQMTETDVSKLDLSEMNMLTALTDKKNSPIAWDLGINAGGNFLMSTAYYSRWLGPVAESDDPYIAVYTEEAFKYKNLSANALYHVQNAIYLPTDTRENFIASTKNAVYSYGAADIYIIADQCYYTEDGKNFYVPENRQYSAGGGGHIVTIVGWDDGYAKENFTGNKRVAQILGYTDVSIPQPKSDGAFIVKNSWGTAAGEEGYFYLSYEDAGMLMSNPTVFLADEMPDNYNSQYLNDEYGCTNHIGIQSGMSVSEVFTNTSTETELLKAVSFLTVTSDIRYDISLRIGEETKKILSGTKKYGGFYTERLDQSIDIPSGAEYEIIVRLESMSTDSATIGTTMNVNGLTNNVKAVPGKSYIYSEGEKKDISADAIYPCIRAYTYNSEDTEYKENILSDSAEAKAAAIESAVTGEPEEEFDDLFSIENAMEITGEDTASMYGALAVNLKDTGTAQAPDTNLPSKFDMREEGLVTAVRNQGNIGSCWTFAATAALESNIVRNNGNAIDYPSSLSLNKSEESVLLTADENKKDIELQAVLEGANNTSTTRINWSVSGDVDSVILNKTSSFSGETVPVVTAVKSGTVTITAQSDADMEVMAKYTLTITAQQAEKVTLSKDTLTLKPGETDSLTATVISDTTWDKTVTWTSSNEKAATVDSNGKVTAVAKGIADIKAVCGNASAVCKVAVAMEEETTVSPTEPTIAPTQPETEVTTKESSTEQTTKVTVPKDGSNITPSSSNTGGGVQGGDTTNITLYVLLILAAIGGGAVVVICTIAEKKKHKK